MKNVILLLVMLSTLLFSADCTRILEKNIGWTIIESKTIEGYKDKGKPKKTDFEGCDYDRVIYFMDGTAITCSSYGYSYSYMPTAIILGKSGTYKGKNYTFYKMIVEGDEYDIQ